jgi:hypothetical protein
VFVYNSCSSHRKLVQTQGMVVTVFCRSLLVLIKLSVTVTDSFEKQLKGGKIYFGSVFEKGHVLRD